MKKSIESVWKDAFTANKDLVAPDVKDLYAKKSIHIVDKFMAMFKINLIALFISAFVILIWFSMAGYPIIASTFFVLLMVLVIAGKQELKNLERVNKNVSSYLYLKSFDQWMKGQIAHYTRVYTVFYPVLFLGICLGGWFSKSQATIKAMILFVLPDNTIIFGMPIAWIIFMAVGSTILAIFGGAIYRFDLKLVYGPILKKFDQMIKDMDELRD